jgi:hypothetical protein
MLSTITSLMSLDVTGMVVISVALAFATGWIFLPRPAWIEAIWPFSLLSKKKEMTTEEKLRQVIADTKIILDGAKASAATIGVLVPGSKAADIINKINGSISIIDSINATVNPVSNTTVVSTATVVKSTPVSLMGGMLEAPVVEDKVAIEKAKKVAKKVLKK